MALNMALSKSFASLSFHFFARPISLPMLPIWLQSESSNHFPPANDWCWNDMLSFDKLIDYCHDFFFDIYYRFYHGSKLLFSNRFDFRQQYRRRNDFCFKHFKYEFVFAKLLNIWFVLLCGSNSFNEWGGLSNCHIYQKIVAP